MTETKMVRKCPLCGNILENMGCKNCGFHFTENDLTSIEIVQEESDE